MVNDNYGIRTSNLSVTKPNALTTTIPGPTHKLQLKIPPLANNIYLGGVLKAIGTILATLVIALTSPLCSNGCKKILGSQTRTSSSLYSKRQNQCTDSLLFMAKKYTVLIFFFKYGCYASVHYANENQGVVLKIADTKMHA
jgi:hypothetical protein